jgi:hypothetical protein
MWSITGVRIHHFEFCTVGRASQACCMAKNKINAHSPNVLYYPSNMSLWERESLAAEAKLATERKSKKKLSARKIISRQINK